MSLAGPRAFSAAHTKIGFVYVGPVGDGGWTYEHNEGRLAVEEEFGDKVERWEYSPMTGLPYYLLLVGRKR